MYLQTVRRACVHYNYSWPKELWTGIMFFDGERITIEEFLEVAGPFTQ